MLKKLKKPVLILDTHRGIYFGFLVSTTNAGRTVGVEKGRHCFRFPIAAAGCRGVYGLAVIGPGNGAKVGPPVTMTIHDVAKVVECSEEAVRKWINATW